LGGALKVFYFLDGKEERRREKGDHCTTTTLKIEIENEFLNKFLPISICPRYLFSQVLGFY
jgi:hypothetical protein